MLESYASSKKFGFLFNYTSSKNDPLKILNEIYNEVVELGSYNQENFIKREFFIDIDGNNKNKEEHVVVLNRRVGQRQKMIIQVTYFESKKANSIVKYAKNTKKILCFLNEGKIKIGECDYNEKEIEFLLPEILKGIRNEKKLLRLVPQNKSK